MQFTSLLSPECTFWGIEASSKKRTFQAIAQLLAQQVSCLSEQELYDTLLNREKLGSTSIGKGIAIPHSRIDNCVKTIGSLFLLKEPVDFDAFDGQAVDLIFVLLVPQDDGDNNANETHLKTLSCLATLFNNTSIVKQLRSSKSQEELYEIIKLSAESLPDLQKTA